MDVSVNCASGGADDCAVLADRKKMGSKIGELTEEGVSISGMYPDLSCSQLLLETSVHAKIISRLLSDRSMSFIALTKCYHSSQ